MPACRTAIYRAANVCFRPIADIRYGERVRAALILIVLAISSPAWAARERTFIASVEGIRVGPKEYVDSFSIDTWGVEIVATFQIPPGWTVTAGSSADPTGTIAGQSSLGVTFLDRSRLKYLKGLVLLRMDGPVQRHAIRFVNGELPATFSGKAEIGTYGGAADRP